MVVTQVIYPVGTKDDLPAEEVMFFLQGGGLPPAETAFVKLVRQLVITDDQANSAHILMTALPAFNVIKFTPPWTDLLRPWLTMS